MTLESIRMVGWNINRNREAFEAIDEYDVALLQEVPVPRAHSPFGLIPAVDGEWSTSGWGVRPWRTAIAAVSPRVHLAPVDCRAFASEGFDGACVGISRPGSIAAADLRVDGQVLCTVASVYAAWESVERNPGYVWADGSAHRIPSDIEPLILRDPTVPVIVAGDSNIYRGYGEVGWPVFAERYRLVFDRARLLGLELKGPEWPRGSKIATAPIRDPRRQPLRPHVPHFEARSSGSATSARLRLRDGVDRRTGRRERAKRR